MPLLKELVGVRSGGVPLVPAVSVVKCCSSVLDYIVKFVPSEYVEECRGETRIVIHNHLTDDIFGITSAT
jgi:hypothetical protein